MTNNKNLQKMIKNPTKGTQEELTDANLERGRRQLIRLQVVIDVLFALLIFTLFQFLPRPDIDNFTKDTIVEAFMASGTNFMIIGVGIILVLIYWNQNNMQFGNLDRTDGKHATISILSIFCLMLYLYFVRLDVELDGVVIALQLESVTLALSGFLSIYSWHYAIKNNLVSDKIKTIDQDGVYLKLMPEPIVAVLSLPFATFGADIWTLSWLLLIPVGWGLKKYRHRIKFLALKKEEPKDINEK
jgi:uncharacterized membrane protein